LRFLLDTHAILWVATDDPKLSARIAGLINQSEHDFFVSAVSAWEITIKQQLGKLPLDIALTDIVMKADYRTLDLSFASHMQASALPLHHKDPFDRMLIAQALEHDMPLITADRDIARYNLTILW
jgi:PIN domain nuclease of toxin-antitoxin system